MIISDVLIYNFLLRDYMSLSPFHSFYFHCFFGGHKRYMSYCFVYIQYAACLDNYAEYIIKTMTAECVYMFIARRINTYTPKKMWNKLNILFI